MAGDWIKMRCNLDTDPAVFQIAAQLGLDELSVVGRLWKVWAWADQHVSDCHAIGVTDVTLDRISATPGFAAAMRRVGWMEGDADTPALPKFDRHNGQSAKRRALATERQSRRRHADVTPESRPERDQRREEKSNTPIVPKGDERDLGFDQFWSAYPRRENKKAALKAWRATADHRPPIEPLLAALHVFTESDQWVRSDGQFIPHPSTWLNGHRWSEAGDDLDPENSEKKETGPGEPDEEIWRAALEGLYPDGDLNAYRRWRDIPESLRVEILQAIAAIPEDVT